MSKPNNSIIHKHVWKAAVTLLALVAWVSIPFLTGDAKAGGAVSSIDRFANLVSPSGGGDTGLAEYKLEDDGRREIDFNMFSTSLPFGTVLTAVVDGNVIGQFTVGSRLRLRTQDGQNVPVIVDGSTAEVRNGATVLVAGAFVTGSPSPSPTGSPNNSPSPSPSGSPNGTPDPSPSGSPNPSPSPTGSPNPGDLFAGLSGPTLNGVVPTGFAQFEIHSSRLELEARLRQVNLPIGSVVNVVINGNSVANMVITSGGESELRLRTDRGQPVPAVTAGSTIQILNGGTVILSGTFAGFTGPSPSPSPSGSPNPSPSPSASPDPSPSPSGSPGPSPSPSASPSPSPSPSPAFGRSFESQLSGSQMNPQVNTGATGEIKVTLNAAETQATIFGEFHGLTSNQTGARIEANLGDTVTVLELGVVGGINGNFVSRTVDVSAAQVQQLRAGLWSTVITSANNPNGEIRGVLIQRSNASDFDGDGRNDFAVFRPGSGTWYSLGSTGMLEQTLGTSSDQIVSGDFDGDGRTDAAVYRPGALTGSWHIRRSSDGGITTASWGSGTDIPVRGDFDGDGRADLAVFRPNNGTWYVQKSDNSGFMVVQWGRSGDKPVAADMDGDGKADLAVFRPSDGNWYWLRSSDNNFAIAQWGQSTDIPVAGDFDGDGKSDVTTYRPSNGTWYIVRSSDAQVQVSNWGMNGDVPVAGDYDNDGKTDLAVYRPSTGVWYVLRSSDAGYEMVQFGTAGDTPVVR